MLLLVEVTCSYQPADGIAANVPLRFVLMSVPVLLK